MSKGLDEFADILAQKVVQKIDAHNRKRFISAPSAMHPDVQQAVNQLLEVAEKMDASESAFEDFQNRQKFRHAVQNLKDTTVELTS
jgi:hypothetical protein